MRTINYKVSYEKLISRLPALFAFVETDEQGVTSIVKATEGKQGNYGMVVADLTCPSFDYTLTNGDKIKITGGSHSYRTIIDAYYMAVKDMKDILSDQWEDKLKKADKDRVPYPIFNEELDKMKIQYPFITFVEIGIGLKYVGLSEEFEEVCGGNLENKKIYPLAPDYIYLGEARTMYEKVIKIEKQLAFWESHIKVCKDDLKYYEALKEEYAMMHGYDKDDETKRPLKEKLEELIAEAEIVAEDYKKLATTPPKLNFNVNLTNTIKDLGMVTPYIQEWIPGKRYYHGDVVYHIDQYGYGMTWKCDIKDIDVDSEANKTYVFKDEFGRKYINGQYDEETELIYFEDGNQTIFDKKNPRKYWDAQSLNWVTDSIVDNERWKYNNNYIVNTSFDTDDKKYVNGELIDKYTYEKVIGDTNKNKCSLYVPTETVKIKGTVNSHLTSLRRFDSYMNRDEQAEMPDNYKDWLWYYRVGTIVNRETKYDEFGNIAVMYPNNDNDEDICKNQLEDVIYARGIKAITDKGEGIYDLNEKCEHTDTVYNLAVWGDVIESISGDNDEETGIGTITFTYWLGAHLMADKDYFIDENGERAWYSIDDDGNYKYYFKNLRLDKDSKFGKNQGVKYTESYIYYQGNTKMEVLRDFHDRRHYKKDDKIDISTYNNLTHKENQSYCEPVYEEIEKEGGEIDKILVWYVVKQDFDDCEVFKRGDTMEFVRYQALDIDIHDTKEPENKKKCKPIEETIWTLVARGEYKNDNKGKTYFEKYINGEFDKGYEPEDVGDEDTNAPYYFKLYDKMEFDTANNLYTYNINIGNRIKEVPYLRTDYEVNIDIRHIDVEKTPLIRYDYYNGVNFQPTINRDVNIERGVTQAFEKHIKFSEVKTFEDLENYSNGGFFVMSKENIDLG